MNKLFACLALAFVAPLFSALYAQERQPPEQYEPPPPVGMDVDYFAPAKQKFSVGFNMLSGPKVSISGSGNLPTDANPAAGTYADGHIGTDTRTDATTGAAISDGNTNTWSFANASQKDGTVPSKVPTSGSYNSGQGGVDVHTYSATINGNNPQRGRAATSRGVELTYERDFGWHLGKVQFDLIGGLGLNKIGYSRAANVSATMTTTTDQYATYNTNVTATNDPADLSGNPLPTGNNPTYTQGIPANGSPSVAVTPPYTAPSTGTDSAGTSVNNTTLASSQPVGPSALSQSQIQVAEQWTVTGAYFTLRAGAEVIVPITGKLSANVSGGPALIYAGTTFSVDQTFTPPAGSPIVTNLSSDYNTVIPAYFANANIEYSLNDTTGFYLGAVLQSGTSYNQAIHSPNGNYTNKIDFSNQEGVRGGITFKF